MGVYIKTETSKFQSEENTRTSSKIQSCSQEPNKCNSTMSQKTSKNLSEPTQLTST